MTGIYIVIPSLFLTLFPDKAFTQNLEILNGIQSQGFHYVAIQEQGKMDTVILSAFENCMIGKKINKNTVELIMETRCCFNYLRIKKEKGIWVYDNQKSGQFASNFKYMSMWPPNYNEMQPNSWSFRITENDEIEYESLSKKKVIIQIKDIEKRNLERVLKMKLFQVYPRL